MLFESSTFCRWGDAYKWPGSCIETIVNWKTIVTSDEGRKQTMRKATWLGIMMSAILLATGCMTGPESPGDMPPVSELQEGLTILKAEADWGINAAYVKEGRVVYFQTRVGPMKPEVYRLSWPEDPPYEMDMRFVDQEGNVFYTMRGGDFLIDPTWVPDLNRSFKAQVPQDVRNKDLDLMVEAAGVAAVEIPKLLGSAFGDHVHHFDLLSQNPPGRNLPEGVEGPVRSPEDMPQIPLEDSIATYSGQWSGQNVWLHTEMYRGSVSYCSWFTTCHHTATIMWYHTTSWGYILACNHGRCWNELSYRCYTASNKRFAFASISGETNYGGNTNVSGGCLTPYDWYADGYNHLCNDDTAYELWQTIYGSTGTTTFGTGGDGYRFQWKDYNSAKSPGYFACWCGNFNGCKNNWGSPSCPGCSHTVCVEGPPLVSGCADCVSSICAVDPYCCNTWWDSICVNQVSTVCGISCPY